MPRSGQMAALTPNRGRSPHQGFVPHRVEKPRNFSWYLNVQQCRNCSRNAKRNFSRQKSDRNYSSKKEQPTGHESGEKLTIFQRFKQTYKEHGKILIGVHLVTSAGWFGSFFYIAVSGVDVVALLERMGASEKILKPFKSSNLGNVAVAYLMYKIATPARYTVTIAGTNFVIRYLRAKGRMKPVQESNKLRHLYREGATKLRKRG
ncbi:hypothetical protein FSP39_015197 [Pinctada imbricata]|uniref:DUF1279 domain-containing protein n=1 Tax=Pinctada imbricata TaxID=66713 RepID=A0AA89BSW2_PINIB|nr:hypothetical protein FSP39_015197 [Pinctada imbricata]